MKPDNKSLNAKIKKTGILAGKKINAQEVSSMARKIRSWMYIKSVQRVQAYVYHPNDGEPHDNSILTVYVYPKGMRFCEAQEKSFFLVFPIAKEYEEVLDSILWILSNI